MKRLIVLLMILAAVAGAYDVHDFSNLDAVRVPDGTAALPGLLLQSEGEDEPEGEQEGFYRSVEGEGEGDGIGVSVDSVSVGIFKDDGWNGSVVLDAGTELLPSLAITGDLNTGMWSSGADTLDWSTGGVKRLTLSTTAVTSTLPIVIPLGAAATPSIYPTGDVNTGIYSSGANSLDFSTDGVLRLTLGTTVLTSTLPYAGANGSAASPAYGFTSDAGNGMYLSAADTVGLSTGGTERVTLSTTNVISTLPYLTADGSAAATAFGFSGDAGNGMYLAGADTLGLSTGGTLRLSLSDSAFTNTLPYVFPAGTEALPSIYPTGDSNTGMWSSGADTLDWSTGGTKRLTLSTAALTSTLPLVLPAGAAGTPSLYGTGYSTTGIYFNGDQMNFAQGGQQRAFMDANSLAVNGRLRTGGFTGSAVAPNLDISSDTGYGLYYVLTGNKLGLTLNGVSAVEYTAGAMSRSHSAGTYTDTLTNYYEAAAHNTLTIRAARGTSAAPAYLNDNDVVGSLKFEARDGVGTWGDGVEIRAQATGAHGAGVTPTELAIYATELESDTQTHIANFGMYRLLPGSIDLDLAIMDGRGIAPLTLGGDWIFGYAADIDPNLTGVSVVEWSTGNAGLMLGTDDNIYFGNSAGNAGGDNTYRIGNDASDHFALEQYDNTGGTWGALFHHDGTDLTVDTGGVNITSGDLTLTDGDVVMSADDAIYLGDPATNGTWRIIRDGDDLVHQRREAGAYVTKQRIED